MYIAEFVLVERGRRDSVCVSMTAKGNAASPTRIFFLLASHGILFMYHTAAVRHCNLWLL